MFACENCLSFFTIPHWEYLVEQETIIQKHEKEIKERERELAEKLKELEEEERKLSFKEKEIIRRENDFIDKAAKFEYDNLMAESNKINIDLETFHFEIDISKIYNSVYTKNEKLASL